MEYRVQLDVFSGPLDLLLFLLKRDEVDIYDLYIHHILEQYMGHVEILRGVTDEAGLDINLAGEFLVMAATLMEIKSAMLLPRPPTGDAAEGSAARDLTDPRYELVQQLLEYKRFKDTAVLLARRQEQFEDTYPRYPAKSSEAPDEPPPVDMDEVQVWDLLSAFSRLMREVGVRKPRFHEVTYDDTPIDLHAADIEDRLHREGPLTLRQLLLGRASRSEMIGVFLALLELIREKKILVRQVQRQVTDDASTEAQAFDDAFSDFQIEIAPEAHRRTYEHASLELSDADAAPTEPDDGAADGAANRADEQASDPSPLSRRQRRRLGRSGPRAAVESNEDRA